MKTCGADWGICVIFPSQTLPLAKLLLTAVPKFRAVELDLLENLTNVMQSIIA